MLYTLDADFDQGVLQDVNHDSPNDDQLQPNRQSVFLPYVNVAASARGTMIRIDVDSGDVLGEWLSAPDGRGRNPSRTTVDKLGNTWLSNRNEATGGQGSVTRVGVVRGGTRVDAGGVPDPDGDYLRGPFAYNTCQDRDGDGLFATSRGLGDIRPWTNAGVVDDDDGVETAADECLITYSRVAGTNTRTVAVDSNNDLWTGGSNTRHQKISGVDGSPLTTPVSFGCGGYGGLVDQAGTLWSARYGTNLLRYEPATGTGACLDTGHGDYGLGMDLRTGEIWHTRVSNGVVVKLDAAGNVLGAFPHGNARSQGVAVDTNGKVWVANINSNNAQRIDPDAGPIGGGGFPVGAVDLTVDLGAGAGPYNYSDMTGSVLGEITAPVGTWSVVQDGGVAGQTWGTVTWNTEPQGSEPAGTSITFEARTSDTEAGLAGEAFVPVSNGVEFALVGRYVEVRATLTAAPSGTSPVLSDVRITTSERTGVFSCQATALNLAGVVLARANPPDVPCVDDFAQVANVNLPAGILNVRADALTATTNQTPDGLLALPPAPGDGAVSSARVEYTRITALLVNIEVGVIQANASVTCDASLNPVFAGSSQIASLRINGVTVAVGSAPLTIPLVIGSLRLNSTTTTATSVTQQALVLDTLLTDVVLGEARANVEALPGEPGGSPCRV
ncbi:choice-of-anchor P family protein [Saccharothrix lopnurensis]|uniref:Choice-of-anchor P family protein n=1 Tax=Saccharothrix lopnurensis TaxID=1670621 RepID=A0ABW1PB85_9PSEU